MALFTWRDVEEEARRRGVDLTGRSAADRRLLQTDPDRAMRAVDIWAGWEKASPEQQALDHQWMEDWRRSAGYSGGAEGLDYRYLGAGAPGEDERSAEAMWRNFPGFAGSVYDRTGSRPQAETWLSAYSGTESEALRPRYDTAADDRAGQLLEALLAYSPRDYDPAADPLYSQYRKTYLREGRRAGEDALARAAELTGGVPGSYALGAASQAENYYAAQLADRLPELEAQDRQRQDEDYQRLLRGYQAAVQAAEDSRARYLDALSQYNADRSFARQRYLDELGQYNAERDFNYGLWGDDYARARALLQAEQEQEQTAFERQLAAEQTAYARQRAEEQEAYERSQAAERAAQQQEQTAYARARDSRSDELKAAQLLAALGDYSGYAPWYGQDWVNRMQALYDAAHQPAQPAAAPRANAGSDKQQSGKDENAAEPAQSGTETRNGAVTLGPAAQAIANAMSRANSPAQRETFRSRIQTALREGKISSEEAAVLRKAIGL